MFGHNQPPFLSELNLNINHFSGTLTEWGPNFQISFQLLLPKPFIGRKKREVGWEYIDVIHFSATGKVKLIIFYDQKLIINRG